jgi:two-component system LytT family response regulator
LRELKILIADDETDARELILYYLELGSFSFSCAQADNGTSALRLLDEFHPDILFLDVNMPEMNGLQVLKEKGSSVLPAIIFTTAFEEYALTAFNYDAVDYLLKPFEKARFDKAVEKAIQYIGYTKGDQAQKFIDKLSVKTGSKTHIIAVREIEFFQSEGAYVNAISGTRTWLISHPLYELETILDPRLFLRIHKSSIVNIQFIREVQSLLNGDCIIKLQSGRQLRGSRTYRECIKKATGHGSRNMF